MSRSTVINKIHDLNTRLFLKKKKRWKLGGMCQRNEHWVAFFNDIFQKPKIRKTLKNKIQQLFKSIFKQITFAYKLFEHKPTTYIKDACKKIRLLANNLFSLRTKILR